MSDALPTGQECHQVYYSGNVQGVGFRYTVRSLAVPLAVTGYVRNLPDGRVELVVEGERTQVAALLQAIRKEMGHNIGEVQETKLPATGRFADFRVRF